MSADHTDFYVPGKDTLDATYLSKTGGTVSGNVTITGALSVSNLGSFPTVNRASTATSLNNGYSNVATASFTGYDSSLEIKVATAVDNTNIPSSAIGKFTINNAYFPTNFPTDFWYAYGQYAIPCMTQKTDSSASTTPKYRHLTSGKIQDLSMYKHKYEYEEDSIPMLSAISLRDVTTAKSTDSNIGTYYPAYGLLLIVLMKPNSRTSSNITRNNIYPGTQPGLHIIDTSLRSSTGDFDFMDYEFPPVSHTLTWNNKSVTFTGKTVHLSYYGGYNKVTVITGDDSIIYRVYALVSSN